MLTNEDIQKLSAVLATKEDLKNFYNKSEIDSKFAAIDNKFAAVESKFIDMDNKFTLIDNQFVDMGGKFNLLQTSIDAFMKKNQTNFEEAVVQKYRLSRVENWVQKASNKIGIDYNP